MPVKKVLQIVLLVLVAALPILMTSTGAQAYEFYHSCGPKWLELPVQYLINEKGSRDFEDFSQVESIIQSSFEVWEEPCCSAFRAKYIGTTPKTEVHAPGPVIFSFADDKFPRQFGGSETIAITYSMLFYEDCSLNQSVIVYNGEDHVFYQAENDDFNEDETRADLQAITTHEIGHLLGLAHSRSQSATMYPSYFGGTEMRYLHEDDIRGVCALYPAECACTSAVQCLSNQQCNNNICEDIPCTADDQCDGMLVCRSGECIQQPCTLHSECASDFRCENNVCVSNCPTCRSCTMDEECGNGLCLDIGQESYKCIIPCSPNTPCPGNSVCINVSEPEDDEPFYLCLNPDYEQVDACPEHYICMDVDDSNTPEPGIAFVPKNKFKGNSCTSVGHVQNPRSPTQRLLLITALFAAAYTRKRRQVRQPKL